MFEHVNILFETQSETSLTINHSLIIRYTCLLFTTIVPNNFPIHHMTLVDESREIVQNYHNMT